MKCFICTVSPARKRVRSNTVWAMVGSWLSPVGSWNLHGSIPVSQSEKTKVRSSPFLAVMKWPHNGSHFSWYFSGGSSCRIHAIPLASVFPCQSTFPEEFRTITLASSTGSPLSSVVTQTIEDSLPHLKWAARFVTRAAAGTYIGSSAPSRAEPRMRLSISTT